MPRGHVGPREFQLERKYFLSLVFSFCILRDKGAFPVTDAQGCLGSGVPGSEKAKMIRQEK